jgi:hypothetical protein
MTPWQIAFFKQKTSFSAIESDLFNHWIQYTKKLAKSDAGPMND